MMSDVTKIYVTDASYGVKQVANNTWSTKKELGGKSYIETSLVKELLGAIDEMGKYYQLSLEVNEIAGELRELVNE